MPTLDTLDTVDTLESVLTVDTPKVAALRPLPPAWVFELLRGSPCPFTSWRTVARYGVASMEHGRFVLMGAAVDDATSMSARELIHAVADLYRSMARAVHRHQRHPVRVWNFIPDIGAALPDANDEEADRYRAFNAGRFEGYAEWFGGPRTFSASVPTSSAVGVHGEQLWVYVLAADEPGIAVENPRQRPSYHYSRRYGVRPPCFARATRLDSQLLIGGTASIVGEDSRHDDALGDQVRETLRNMSAVIVNAGGARGVKGVTKDPLSSALRDIRVHVAQAAHASQVIHTIADRVSHLTAIEVVQADLCRRELLVEIEGVAVVS